MLLVTTLLSLVTMFDTVRNNSPDALELKSIEVRIINYRCDKSSLNKSQVKTMKKRPFPIVIENVQSTKVKLFLPGLAALLHILRISGVDGILCGAVRNPLRFTLEKNSTGGCSRWTIPSSRSAAAKRTTVAFQNSLVESKSPDSIEHLEFAERRNSSKRLEHPQSSRMTCLSSILLSYNWRKRFKLEKKTLPFLISLVSFYVTFINFSIYFQLLTETKNEDVVIEVKKQLKH